MDMKWRKLAAMGCIVTMTAVLTVGCGGTSADSSTSTESTEATEEQESEAVTLQVTAVDGSTITGNVGEMSEAPSGDQAPGGDNAQKPDEQASDSQQTPPEKPEGDSEQNPDDQASDNQQTPPEKPDGDSAQKPDDQASDNQQTPPEKPDGNSEQKPGDQAPGGESPDGQKPDGQPSDGQQPGGAPQGSPFTASGETQTFTLTDTTEITVESAGNTTEGTEDDITVGSILEVTLDTDGNALTVIVKSMNGGGGPQGGFGGSSEVTNGTSANTMDEDTSVDGETYSSTGDDENALRVDGATATLSNITVEKTDGSSSNTEDGDWYGQNAGLLALNGATVNITGATVNTSTQNGNGVFSYGKGTTVNISDSTIRTTGNNSGGIHTTGGGTMNADNLDVETSGNSAAAIRSDRGGGDVNVTGGTYTTNGTGSPAIYCTADISVEDAELTANASEGVVVEGKNSVSLKNCNLVSSMDNTYNGDSSENIHGIMIYQSMSGDAESGTASFSSVDGSITAKKGDLFYVTNTDCEIYLQNTALTMEDTDGVLLRVEGNNSSRGWGTQGANGGTVTMTMEKQTLNGDIIVDEISSLDLTMDNGTTFTGTTNSSGDAGTVNITLSDDSSWTLTGDSYVTSFSGDLSHVTANGYHLYVNGEQYL